MQEERTEVLVVGAGPVGLWTALVLADAGVAVTLIDREERTAARSYACALHPHTLELFERFGLTQALLKHGRQAQVIAFYDHAARRAEINLAALGGRFPFLLILPQNALEQVLEQRLAQAGLAVRWNHRFDGFTAEVERLAVTVEELGGTATGYIVPHWETVVKERWPVHTQFLVGADGHDSLVRQRLGIESQRVAEPEFFAAYEFESEEPAADEVRVVLDETTTNVLWPLPGNKCRWTFQLLHSELPPGFPEKERRAVRVEQFQVDERICQSVQKVARHRAPWFTASVKQLAWCSAVAFERRLARAFGRERGWLVGDAAHQTGPVGVQSMNRGFCEGVALAETLRRILRQDAGLELLAGYDREQRQEWQRLLGLSGGLKANAKASAWVRDRAAKLLPCLPAGAGDLARVAGQLGLDFTG